MRFLIDENVPDSVARFLAARGHEVLYARELLPSGTPDQVIATLGDELECIIVSWDRDFDRLVSRAPTGSRAALRRLGRLTYRCKAPNGLRRTEQLIELIEFEYAQLQQRRDRRLLIQIGDSFFRVDR